MLKAENEIMLFWDCIQQGETLLFLVPYFEFVVLLKLNTQK